jgi:VWFA-related protein
MVAAGTGRMKFSYIAWCAVLICTGAAAMTQSGAAPQDATSVQANPAQTNPASGPPQYTLRTSVNRVLVDVVVTDTHGQPVHGLTKDDFTIEEDGRLQTVLSFDVFDFDKGMDYVPPPKLPALQPDTFVNLPVSPERGPLYVLFYDLVNIPQEDQIPARAQLVRFIQNKPAGARFAIFVSSDGVHLVQGFTSDRKKLLAAVDPQGTGPHVPKVFLMGVNFGQGDKLAAATRLDGIAQYLASLPGRKNIIWFASEFPLSLFPSKDGADAYVEEARDTINLLARNQIAVYPSTPARCPSPRPMPHPAAWAAEGSPPMIATSESISQTFPPGQKQAFLAIRSEHSKAPVPPSPKAVT